MLELLNLFYYNLFDKNSSLIINSKRFFVLFLYANIRTIFNLQNNSRKILVKNEFYYFKNNFQKIFAYFKNFIIYTYIIYYQNFYQISTH